ncbi:MAG: ketoacyl-ACP synthase III [Armatimonadetes bacterium]|nr:ketoacyl-ACP synthase III [Armatimonadota bacterium]MDE2205084.1 ketoacyl-ACP synthase III [Armatimonadota bacterium]
MTTADALPASSLDLAQEAISSPRIGAGFASLGAAVPKRILTNAELAEMVETSDEWIRSRTGIEQRHVAGPDEFTSDLAVAASLDALRRSPFTAEQIDLVLCATTSGDYLWPATASLVQHRIGARRAAAFDVAAACSGFCCAVATAAAWIRSNDADTVLVVGADTLTKQLNWRDRATCVLFGDGAGAAVMTACSPDEGVLASVLGSDGAGVEQVWIPAGGTREPITPEGLVAGRNRIHMRGADVYRFAVEVVPRVTQQALERANLTLEDVDLLVLHQANIRIMHAAADRLGIRRERVYTNLQRYGNTSAASIPIALNEAARDGMLPRGSIVVTVGFGSGLSWGANVIRWGGGV